MDTLANLITAIHNAELAGHVSLRVPSAKMSQQVLTILKESGYLESFAVEKAAPQDFLNIELKQPLTVHTYRRISKPGRRFHIDATHIPVIRQGLGTVVISTSKGVMSGKQARKEKIGGEIICTVF